jgi:hypothetical protein
MMNICSQQQHSWKTKKEKKRRIKRQMILDTRGNLSSSTCDRLMKVLPPAVTSSRSPKRELVQISNYVNELHEHADDFSSKK